MVMTIRLKLKTPIKLTIWIISGDHEKLYAHKFQGNPPNNLALKKSESAIPKEKIDIPGVFREPKKISN